MSLPVSLVSSFVWGGGGGTLVHTLESNDVIVIRGFGSHGISELRDLD